jgi:hypothetical protein
MDEAIGCLTYGWSGYGPAHSGAISVAIWGGLFILRSSDIDDEGPFLTIGDIHDLEYFWAEGLTDGHPRNVGGEARDLSGYFAGDGGRLAGS